MKENKTTPFLRFQPIRIVALIIAYACILLSSTIISVLVRFDFSVPPQYWKSSEEWVPIIIGLKLIILGFAGQYKSLLTFFSFPDAKRLFIALGATAILEAVFWFVFHGQGMPPRGVIAVDLILSFVGLVCLRMGMRILRESYTGTAESRLLKSRKRVAILGAGSAGAALAREIQTKPGLGLEVVCFLDDDTQKIGKSMHGRQIVGSRHELGEIISRLSIDKCIIAMPNASPAVIKETVGVLSACRIDHDILPSVTQLLHRKVTVSHLRHVEPEDLLGRDSIVLDDAGISSLIDGKVIAITGAGGSIGSELCRQIAEHNPSKIILIERSEPALFAINQELVRSHRHINLLACASSVCDEESINRLFSKYQPALVFHAAAHKHVPLMEGQPAEAIKNNSIGTEIVARLAAKHGVSKFILVSTDKAVNPTNVMGASKRLAEMILEEQQNKESGCAFSAVRFGNVLGSSGSVVPTFRSQIAEGGPLTVTHPEVTRYFMSIPEAVGLILQSSFQSTGGEIFVLDMGEPIKIVNLARQMIELCGFRPDEDIKIEFTGLRPGEKLYEEPIHHMENVEPTNHPKIRLLRNNRSGNSGNLAEELMLIYREAAGDGGRLKAWLASKIPEYHPSEN